MYNYICNHAYNLYMFLYAYVFFLLIGICFLFSPENVLSPVQWIIMSARQRPFGRLGHIISA